MCSSFIACLKYWESFFLIIFNMYIDRQSSFWSYRGLCVVHEFAVLLCVGECLKVSECVCVFVHPWLIGICNIRLNLKAWNNECVVGWCLWAGESLWDCCFAFATNKQTYYIMAAEQIGPALLKGERAEQGDGKGLMASFKSQSQGHPMSGESTIRLWQWCREWEGNH